MRNILALILLCTIGWAQSGSQPVYPVDCPSGSHLDTVCAETAKKAYDRYVDHLTSQYALAVEAATKKLNETITACNGNQVCIDDAKLAHSNQIVYLTGNLQQDKATALAGYKSQLLDCCVPNTPSVYEFDYSMFQAGGNPVYPVSCGPGTHLDTACAQSKKAAYDAELQLLDEVCVNKIEELMTQFEEGIITFDQYEQAFEELLMWKDRMLFAAEIAYKAALLTCCVEN